MSITEDTQLAIQTHYRDGTEFRAADIKAVYSDLPIANIRTSLATLCKQGFIERVDLGLYRIAPIYSGTPAKDEVEEVEEVEVEVVDPTDGLYEAVARIIANDPGVDHAKLLQILLRLLDKIEGLDA